MPKSAKRTLTQEQIIIAEFGQPIGMKMHEGNRWMKKGMTIPWAAIEGRYVVLFTNQKGNVAKPLRLGLSACIIQAEYGYSDVKITLQIQEGAPICNTSAATKPMTTATAAP